MIPLQTKRPAYTKQARKPRLAAKPDASAKCLRWAEAVKASRQGLGAKRRCKVWGAKWPNETKLTSPLFFLSFFSWEIDIVDRQGYQNSNQPEK